MDIARVSMEYQIRETWSLRYNSLCLQLGIIHIEGIDKFDKIYKN